MLYTVCITKLIYGILLHTTTIFRGKLLIGENTNTLNGRLRRLLLEYLKDSNRSDKQLAKVLGVSQSTVSRLKTKLITDGFIRHFSAIPDFAKMGYNILAFSFVKFEMDQVIEIEEGAKYWAQNNPKIIFTAMAEGMGMGAITVSLHKDYASYKKFFAKSRMSGKGKLMAYVKFILLDLKGDVTNLFASSVWQENRKPNG